MSKFIHEVPTFTATKHKWDRSLALLHVDPIENQDKIVLRITSFNGFYEQTPDGNRASVIVEARARDDAEYSFDECRVAPENADVLHKASQDLRELTLRQVLGLLSMTPFRFAEYTG